MSNNTYNFDIYSENIEKLILLYKVVLLKKIKIRNSREYAEKILKLDSKIMEKSYSTISCFKNTLYFSNIITIRTRGIIHPITFIFS